MFTHPQFDPVALSLGPVSVHWYGLMYLVAFGLAWLVGRRAVDTGLSPLNRTQVEDLLFWGMLGAIAGGRLGYVLFYKPGDYLADPLSILAVWQGGMSFHGGLLGVIAALWLYARRQGVGFWTVADLAALMVPLGLAAGRVGNFINGELWGRPTDLPWGMVFPQAGDAVARHPSQLYQVALEGLLLFVVLWTLAHGRRATLQAGQLAAAFLMGYGLCRFVAEFGREPDAFLGTLALGLSMGQWLSLPMIAAGVVLWRLKR